MKEIAGIKSYPLPELVILIEETCPDVSSTSISISALDPLGFVGADTKGMGGLKDV